MDKRFPGVHWFCDHCNAPLEKQLNFDDHCLVWKCAECGYENDISQENIYELEKVRQSRPKTLYLKAKDGTVKFGKKHGKKILCGLALVAGAVVLHILTRDSDNDTVSSDRVCNDNEDNERFKSCGNTDISNPTMMYDDEDCEYDDYYDDDCEAISICDAADIYFSSGCDEDYMFDYTHDELMRYY